MDVTPSQIEIREIKQKDTKAFEGIIRIQKSLNKIEDLLKSGAKNSSTGFLISYSSEQELEKFLADRGSIFVAEKNQGQVVGFITAMPGSVFIDTHKSTVFTWTSDKARLVYESSVKAGDHVYVSQIGVDSGLNGKGIARRLHSALIDLLRPSVLTAAVLQEPVSNERSHNFFQKIGYDPVAELFTSNLNDIKAVKSTFYVLVTNPGYQ